MLHHVHGSAACKCQCRGCSKIDFPGQRHNRTRRHDDLLSEAAVPLDAKHHVVKAHRLFAALTVFARAAEEVGLDCNAITRMEMIYISPNLQHLAGNLTTWREWKLDGQGPLARFGP